MARGNARRSGVSAIMQAAAKILRQDDGPNIAAMEFSGWDTHANQRGRLAAYLDAVVEAVDHPRVDVRAAVGDLADRVRGVADGEHALVVYDAQGRQVPQLQTTQFEVGSYG